MCTGLRGVAYWVVREKVTRTREREKSSTSAFSCCSSASARKFLYSVDARTHRHTHNSSLKRNNFLFLPSCRWSRFQPRNSHTRARLPFFFHLASLLLVIVIYFSCYCVTVVSVTRQEIRLLCARELSFLFPIWRFLRCVCGIQSVWRWKENWKRDRATSQWLSLWALKNDQLNTPRAEFLWRMEEEDEEEGVSNNSVSFFTSTPENIHQQDIWISKRYQALYIIRCHDLIPLAPLSLRSYLL